MIAIAELKALLPIIAISLASIILMLVIAVRREYIIGWWTAFLGILISMATVPIAKTMSPILVTPLINIDAFSLFFTTLLFFSGAIVLVFCYDYFKHRPGENEELFLLILTALLGGAVLVSSSHFATFFIGLETLSVSLFALIAYPVTVKRSLEASFKYLILSGISSAFLLFGFALIYSDTGTFFFEEISNSLANTEAQPFSFVGAVMVIIALGFKLSLVPFHMWTSDVYEGAPAPVTAFVATVSKGAIFAVLLRFFVQGNAYSFENLYPILAFIGIITILGGNILALLQSNIKRILAYSSIAHLGYIIVAFAAGLFIDVELVIESITFYLIAYIITTLGAFGIVTAMSNHEQEAEMVSDYTGLFWKKPLTAILFTTMLLSLAGIPLTAGFISKFYVFVAGVDSQLWLLLSVVIIGSGIGLFYYLRIVLEMAKQPTDIKQESPLLTISTGEVIALAVLTVLIFWLGIFPNSLIETITDISRALAI